MPEFGLDTINALKTEKMMEAVRVLQPIDKLASTVLFPKRWGQWQGTAQWREIQFYSQAAPLGDPTAPAHKVDLLGRAPRSETPAYMLVKKSLDQESLFRLSQLGNSNVQGTQEFINDELTDLLSYIHARVESSLWGASTGTWAVDQTLTAENRTQIVVTKFSMDFAVHKPSLTVGNWAKTGNLITDGLDELEQKMIDQFGDIAPNVYCNNTVVKKLLQNYECSGAGVIVDHAGTDYMGPMHGTASWSNFVRSRSRTTGVPLGSFMFNQYDKGLKPHGGSYAKFLTDNYIHCFPDREWRSRHMGVIELTGAVPTENGNDIIQTPPGLFAYSDVSKNPVSLDIYVGYSWVPCIKYPNGVTYAKITS